MPPLASPSATSSVKSPLTHPGSAFVMGAIIGVVIGGIAGALLIQPSSFAAGKQAGLDAAQAKIAAMPLFATSGKEASVNDISGMITSIDGNVITMSADQVNPNPLAPQTPSVRHVTVGDTTTMTLRTQKAPAVWQQELAAAQKTQVKSDHTIAAPTPLPAPFTDAKIALADLKAGMTISVHADSDIKTADAFNATAIVVNVMAAEKTSVTGSAPSADVAPTTK